MENISLIKNALDEKKVQESLKQIDQRTENAQKYFNSDFRMPISQTHNNSPMNNRIGEVLQLERSISKVRDAKNEVFINDEEKLNHDRSVFSSPKIRKAMGVFSDYEVQLHQQNEQKINNIYHLDQSQQNTGRGNDGKISTEVARFNTLIQAPQFSQNVSRMSQNRNNSIFNKKSSSAMDFSIYSNNGRVNLNRSGFRTQNFLTEKELKNGDSNKLDSLDKSFSKLRSLLDRNCDRADIDNKHYKKPRNFSKVYDSSNHSIHQHKLINQKSYSKSGLDDPLAQTMKINQNQKQIYHKLQKSNYTSSNQKSAAYEKINQVFSPTHQLKKYQSNFQTMMGWQAKEREFKTAMGAQHRNYNIISQSDRLSQLQDLKTRTTLKKVNGISEYAQEAHISSIKINKDYQQAFQNDPNIFRRSQGLLSHHANHSASHNLIMPAFKKA
eukprot:403366816